MSRSQAGTQATTIEQITLHCPYDSQNDGGAAQVYGRIGATTAQPCPASRIKVQARQKLCWARKDLGGTENVASFFPTWTAMEAPKKCQNEMENSRNVSAPHSATRQNRDESFVSMEIIGIRKPATRCSLVARKVRSVRAGSRRKGNQNLFRRSFKRVAGLNGVAGAKKRLRVFCLAGSTAQLLL
jgi:hypothetical protein